VLWGFMGNKKATLTEKMNLTKQWLLTLSMATGLSIYQKVEK
jgi:hypothetical protein